MFRDHIKNGLRQLGHAFTSTVHDRLDAIERRLDHVERAMPPGNEAQFDKLMRAQTALLKASIHTVENLHALAGRSIVECSAAPVAADLALMEFLYSFLPSRVVVEVGAHAPESTRALLNAGYDVQRVRELAFATSAGRSAQASREGAVGLADIAGDAMTGIEQIDGWRASVVAVDCGSTFAEVVAELRGREYHWHVVLCSSSQGLGAFSNGSSLPDDAHGRAFFFRDYRVFAEAQAWCGATLPRVYFK